MTTQEQIVQPQDLGQRVAKLEGRFDELSPRIDALQRSVDSLHAEFSGFKNTVIFLILGSWFTLMAALIVTVATDLI